VTGGSILEELRVFLAEDPDRSRSYRILLMSPDGDGMRQQEAFARGLTLPQTPDHLEQIDEARDEDSARLTATLRVLKASTAFKEGRLQMRLFDEFLPWWAYIIDGSRMVIGILQFGRNVEDGPAAVVRRASSAHNLFDAFHENFERVWRSARPV
jgi:hypothetical protein